MAADPRNAYLVRTYGITVTEYECMAQAQGGQCPICLKVPSGQLVVDHDHKTGLVRGLICTYCNFRVIGRHREPDLLQRAADYLRTPPAVTLLGERKGQPKTRKRR